MRPAWIIPIWSLILRAVLKVRWHFCSSPLHEGLSQEYTAGVASQQGAQQPWLPFCFFCSVMGVGIPAPAHRLSRIFAGYDIGILLVVSNRLEKN
ncbi:hypothetical protein B9Z19DRAFT_473996 [Tuber borchii]|uniref:Secreted protein n=1 Tax=Tuber borchii TaxID=42251 RepID=A0A2T6ZF87_TUBBO|nr:hypothetical protein B9Z19DRAFT_473996 [Tuber borchii]